MLRGTPVLARCGALWALLLVALPPRPGAAYQQLQLGTAVSGRLAPSETVTYVYRSGQTRRYLLVELTFTVQDDRFPDPLLMVAYGSVPRVFYSGDKFTTNATFYDETAFQLVKTYHFVAVDTQLPPRLSGEWFISVTNLPVWSQNAMDFTLSITDSDVYPCPRSCSGHGTCQSDGSCACTAGWGDTDCSVLMHPITPGKSISTNLAVDEWKYYYVTLQGASSNADSFALAQMEITSSPRCDALLYFKHEDVGFTALPTHYDFQLHSAKDSFYGYEDRYQVKAKPIRAGQYIVGIFNYNGRNIRTACDVTLTVTSCSSDSCADDSRKYPLDSTSWFLTLFILAGLPLFCFIPFFFCVRRWRHAQQRRNIGVAAAGRQPRDRAPRPGLTADEIESLPQFTVGSAEHQSHPSLESDTCSVCLAEFEQGERVRVLHCQHCFHADCIDQWLCRHRSCPLCKADQHVPGAQSHEEEGTTATNEQPVATISVETGAPVRDAAGRALTPPRAHQVRPGP